MTFDRQVDILYRELRWGKKIDRVGAFQEYGVADLRSRICDVEKQFAISIDRETVPGKRYKRYFLKDKQL